MKAKLQQRHTKPQLTHNTTVGIKPKRRWCYHSPGEGI